MLKGIKNLLDVFLWTGGPDCLRMHSAGFTHAARGNLDWRRNKGLL